MVESYRSRAGEVGFDADLTRALIAAEAGEVDIVLRDAAGRVLVSPQPFDEAEWRFEPPPPPGFRFTNAPPRDAGSPGTRTYTADVGPEGLPFRFGQVRATRKGIDALLAHHARMTLVVVPCAVVLGGVLTWWLAALALAPLTRMADDAKRLGPTRLDRRISRSDAGDEADTLAQALNEALEQIGATFESLNAFAAHASHELRTPLTIVRGEIETALERAADADAIRALESSLVETDRMSHLVEGLLKLARLGAQSLPEDAAPLELGALLAEVLDDAEVLASEKEQTLRRGRWDAVEVAGAPALLRQMGWNLVENAIVYTPPGGSIEVSLIADDDGRCTIAVSDDGPGVAPNHLERLFEPFYRVRDDGTGFGLGLALVRRIAELHGGEVDVRSELEQGSTFSVTLPGARVTARC